MVHVFGDVFKKSSLFPNLSRLSPTSSSRSFMVLHFTFFRSVILFELIFVKTVGLCLDYYFLHVNIRHHLLKRLFPLNCSDDSIGNSYDGRSVYL